MEVEQGESFQRDGKIPEEKDVLKTSATGLASLNATFFKIQLEILSGPVDLWMLIIYY